MNQQSGRTEKRPKLWALTYVDFNAGTRLTVYADTIVFDNSGNRKSCSLCASPPAGRGGSTRKRPGLKCISSTSKTPCSTERYD